MYILYMYMYMYIVHPATVLISRQTLNFSVALPQCPYLVRTGIISVKLSGVVVQLMQDMLHPALICACIYMYV